MLALMITSEKYSETFYNVIGDNVKSLECKPPLWIYKRVQSGCLYLRGYRVGVYSTSFDQQTYTVLYVVDK